jgi:hypothetical protein
VGVGELDPGQGPELVFFTDKMAAASIPLYQNGGGRTPFNTTEISCANKQAEQDYAHSSNILPTARF